MIAKRTRIGKFIGAIAVLAVFLLYGLTIYFFKGLLVFRLGFYLPALCILLYLYLTRKKLGLFLNTVAFVLALMLAIVITLDLIPI